MLRHRIFFLFFCVLLVLTGGAAVHSAPMQKTGSLLVAPQTGHRVALVVGCNEYGANRLNTPRNDAEAVAKTLTGLGWDVEIVANTNAATLRTALKGLTGKLDKNSVGLFYFSGLSFSHKGTVYALPIGSSLQGDQTAALAGCVSETEIIKAMASAQSRIVIFNGGRTPAFGKSSVMESLELSPPLPPGTLVAYDSAAGHTAYEAGKEPVSPYVRFFVKNLEAGGASFIQVFQKTGAEVAAEVTVNGDTQRPEFRQTLQTDFLVAASKNPVPPPVKPLVPKPKPVIAVNVTGEKWALLIGVEQYQSDDIRPLNFTLRDVAALKNTLPLTGFAPEHILAMTSDLPNKNINYPTNTNILKRLKTLKKQLNEDDTLLIYFSGHGFQEQEGGQNFLGSVNADISDNALLKKTTVSIEELREALGGLQASQLILIMDCCRNNPFKKDTSKGGSDANARTSSFTKDLSLVSDSVGKKIGTAILFACQEGQRSWEDPDAQQGAFTLFLLEALKGKATRDGTLTITDLAGYVEKRMREWCIRTGKDQRPDYEQHNRAQIILQEGPAVP